MYTPFPPLFRRCSICSTNKKQENRPAVKHYLVYVEKEFRCVIIICKSSVFTFIYKCFPGHGCCICISEQGNWVCVCVISFFHSCSSNWRESVWRKHCCVFFSGLLSELFRKASKFVKQRKHQQLVWETVCWTLDPRRSVEKVENRR